MTTVLCVRYSDDFDQNSIDEWIGVVSSNIDTTNAKMILADSTYIYPANIVGSYGTYAFGLMRSADSGSVDVYVAGHSINFTNAGTISFDGGATESFTITAPSSIVKIMIKAVGTSISIYENNALKGTKTGLELTESNVKFKMNTSNWYIYNLIVNAISTEFENGVAASIGGVNHGARYDTPEEVYYEFPNTVKHGEYAGLLSAKSIVPESATVVATNITDTTSVRTDGVMSETIDVTPTQNDHVIPIVLKHSDRGDTIRVAISNNGDAPMYVETLAVAPIYEVE